MVTLVALAGLDGDRVVHGVVLVVGSEGSEGEEPVAGEGRGGDRDEGSEDVRGGVLVHGSILPLSVLTLHSVRQLLEMIGQLALEVDEGEVVGIVHSGWDAAVDLDTAFATGFTPLGEDLEDDPGEALGSRALVTPPGFMEASPGSS